MPEELIAYDDEQDRRIRETVNWKEDFAPPPRHQKRRRQTGTRPPIRGVLLEDLVHNGTAQVAVLDWVDSHHVQAAKLIGSVDGGTFTIKYNGTVAVPLSLAEETKDIPFDASDAEMLDALADLPSLSKRVLKVDAFTGMWFIHFLEQAIGSVKPLTINKINLTGGSRGAAVIDEHWEDSGRPETVHPPVPVGPPTPMRAGMIVVCIWITGPGYTVIVLEPRDWFEL